MRKLLFIPILFITTLCYAGYQTDNLTITGLKSKAVLATNSSGTVIEGSSYQPLATLLTTLSNLANSSGALTNNGAGGLSWVTYLTTVADDSHNHTGSTLSGIDISSDTNLTAGNGINLTDDDLNIDYNTTNLQITSNQINTIQNIATSSSPTFVNLTTTGYLSSDNFIDSSHYTGFPNRTDTSLSWADGSYTLTLTATNDPIWINGVSYNINTLTKQLSVAQEAATGLYWFWITAPGGVPQLNVDTVIADHFGQCLVAIVYWNATTNTGILSDERHWFGRDKVMHEYLHDTIGARFESGGTITYPTGSTFQITQCEITDEDIPHILSQATTCKMMYKNGSADWEWDTGNTTLKKVVTGAEKYNNGNALASVSNSNHFATWVFATNNTDEPFIVVIGQRQDVTLASARTNNTPASLSLGTLPSPEMKLLYRVLWKQGTTAPIETADYRTVSNAPVANYTATDHSALSNLTSGDDHTQYWINTGTGTRTESFATTGNIGIGTTTANNPLTVIGNSTISGNVGIGTTSTSYPLSVVGQTYHNGNIGIGTTTASNPLTVIGNATVSGNVGIGTTSASLPLSVTGQSYFNGNVGIGTTSPVGLLDVNAKLTVLSGGNVGIGSTVPTSLLDVNGTVKSTAFSTTGGYTQTGTTANTFTGTPTFSNATYSALFTGGNVGIGTTTPATTLNLVKANSTYGLYIDEYSTTTTTRSILGFRKSNSNTLGTLVTTQSGDLIGQFIAYGVNNLATPAFENAAGIFFYQDGAVGGGSQRVPGKMSFWTSNGSADIAEKMVLTKDGNVGIGTTGPGYALDIVSTGNTYTRLQGGNSSATGLYLGRTNAPTIAQFDYLHSTDTFRWIYSGTTPMTLSAGGNLVNTGTLTVQGTGNSSIAGNVGIGTTAPEVKLDVKGQTITQTAKIQGYYIDSSHPHQLELNGFNTGWNAGLQFGSTNANNRGLFTFGVGTGDLIYSTSNDATNYVNLLTIKADGNVGIGTTAPTAVLDVRGSAIFNEDGADSNLRVEGDTDANLLFTDASSDNVGIGTSVPSSKLQVIGTVAATTFSGAGTSLTGTGAGFTAGAVTNGIYTTSSWTGGDLGGTGLAATVTDDSHAHTTTTISGLNLFNDVTDFPADPNADKFLEWDDSEGKFIFADAAGGAFDSTTVDATTWSDGANATNIWTFDVSGTDWTMTIGSALATFSAGVTISGTTTLGVVAGTIDAGGATSLEIPNGANPTCDASGEIAINTTDKTLELYNGANQVAFPTIHIAQGTFDLKSQYAVDPDLWLIDLHADSFPHGIYITKIYVDATVADPTTELNANLNYCDATSAAFPGANATLIKAIDTTTGNFADAAVNTAVPTGKTIYITIDADPTDANVQYHIRIHYIIPTS